jgi:hypothetical protein
MAEKDPAKFETRRRWLAMMKDGSIAALRSEGRLVSNYVFYAADWTTGEVRFSMRRVASLFGVHPTTVRRGIAQLLEGGILEILGKPEGPGATLYGVCERAPLVRAPDTSRAQSRTRAVRAPDTSGAQSAHEPCAVRTRPVRGLRTLCARNSVLFSGSPVTTTESSTAALPAGGEEPAGGVPVSQREEGDSAAGLTGGAQPRQEDVA